MTANRRIVLNFVATYGRSLYSLALGLICGRWTLQALGVVDYGLFGLIGGLTTCIAFFNSLMSNAIGRYFAFSVGRVQKLGSDGLDECRRWFNLALTIHTVVPIVALIVGYPVGMWAIEHFLNIPMERISSCRWVWRWVAISCFLNMVSVPYNAMYQAKQYIAELTVYSFVTSTVNAFFLYYMISHPGDWLSSLAFWTCMLSLAPHLIIALRAYKLFEECVVVPKYLWDWDRIKELALYAFYRFFGALSIMIKSQGMSILVNKYLGPARNAAYSVGGTVSAHADSLAGSLLGALSPAITNAYGAGDCKRVRVLVFSACKLSCVLALIFFIPLFLEVSEVLTIWLKTPPEGAAPICCCLMGTTVLEHMSCGLYMAIFADGRIRNYQMSCLAYSIVTVPFAWLLMINGLGIVSVGYALLLGRAIIICARLYYAQRLCGLSAEKWLSRIFTPLLIATLFALSFGLVLRHVFAPSFLRIVYITVVVNVVFIPMTWFMIFENEERRFVIRRVNGWIDKFRK